MARCMPAAGPRCATYSKASMPKCRRIMRRQRQKRRIDTDMPSNDDDRGGPQRHGRLHGARRRRVVVFGEDVGYFGGVFRCTQGLQAEIRQDRCFDAPISESGIVGTAIGMAAYGLRPCVEIQFADYMYPAYDQITQEAARIRYRSNGDFTCPIVLRMPTGGGIFGGQTHSQSPEALFTHVCGSEGGRAVQPL